MTVVERECVACGQPTWSGIVQPGGRMLCIACNNASGNTTSSNVRKAMDAIEQIKAQPATSDIDREARQLWLDIYKESHSSHFADNAVEEFRKRFDPEYQADAPEAP